MKYIEHVLDLFDLDYYKTHFLQRFEIAYVAESHQGDQLNFYVEKVGDRGEKQKKKLLLTNLKKWKNFA